MGENVDESQYYRDAKLFLYNKSIFSVLILPEQKFLVTSYISSEEQWIWCLFNFSVFYRFPLKLRLCYFVKSPETKKINENMSTRLPANVCLSLFRENGVSPEEFRRPIICCSQGSKLCHLNVTFLGVDVRFPKLNIYRYTYSYTSSQSKALTQI